MQDKHVQQIIIELRKHISLRKEKGWDRIIQSLSNLRLSPGRPKKTLTPTESWVEAAREFAKEQIKIHGECDIETVKEYVPIPKDVSNRVAGGLFRHPDFIKIGTRLADVPPEWGPLPPREIGIYRLRNDTDTHAEENEIVTW